MLKKSNEIKIWKLLFFQASRQEVERFVLEWTSRKISLPVTWGHQCTTFIIIIINIIIITIIIISFLSEPVGFMHYIKTENILGSSRAVSRHILPWRWVSDLSCCNFLSWSPNDHNLIIKKLSNEHPHLNWSWSNLLQSICFPNLRKSKATRKMISETEFSMFTCRQKKEQLTFSIFVQFF